MKRAALVRMYAWFRIGFFLSQNSLLSDNYIEILYLWQCCRFCLIRWKLSLATIEKRKMEKSWNENKAQQTIFDHRSLLWPLSQQIEFSKSDILSFYQLGIHQIKIRYNIKYMK